MRASAVMDVGLDRPVKTDGVWGGVDDRVASGGNEGDEDVVACFDGDGTPIVVHGHVFCGSAVDAEGAVHAFTVLVREGGWRGGTYGCLPWRNGGFFRQLLLCSSSQVC